MTDREICRSYHTARHKAQQIQILAELNDVDNLEIIKVLVRGGEKLPRSTANKLFKRLDKLEMEIREREREYKAIAAVLKGENRLRTVYICSPYRADDSARLDRNIDYAQTLTKQAIEAGLAPITPHFGT